MLKTVLAALSALSLFRGPELTREEIARMSAEVRALAAERNAVILAHNYQVPEIQDVADHMGDSLGLSRLAASTEAEVILISAAQR